MFLSPSRRLWALPHPLLKFCMATSSLRVKHVSDLTVRYERKRYLNNSLLNKNKLTLHGELRPFDSTIVSLKNLGKCAAVIKARSGFPELDIVLDGPIFKKLQKDHIKRNGHIYVRVNGEEILCTIDKIELFEGRFVAKVFLNRFVVGEPNEIQVVIEPIGILNNPHLFAGQAPTTEMINTVKIITYNLDYPPILTYDCSFVNPLRPYRYADLANSLPPGIYLDPSVNLNMKLLALEGANDQGLQEQNNQAEQIQKLKELEKEEARKKKDQKKTATGTTEASGTGGDKKDTQK